jgi:hypothetical protein
MLEEIQRSLAPFYEATIKNEGKRDHTLLSGWSTTLEYLITKLDERRRVFTTLAHDEPNNKSYELLQVFADASWEKVREYRNRSTKESPAYYAAMMFDPRQKTGWFEENWIEDHQAGWLAKELDNVKSLWEDEYKGRHAAYFSPPTPAYKPVNADDDQFGGLAAFQAIKRTASSLVDNLEKYLGEDMVNEDPLEYWNKHHLSQPDLARFAYDMLAIPPMSDECERTFSSAKHLITDSRNRLHMDVVEANECLKAWYGVPTNYIPTGTNEDGTEKYTEDQALDLGIAGYVSAIEKVIKQERATKRLPGGDSGDGDSDVEDDSGIFLDDSGEVILDVEADEIVTN